MHSWLTPPYTPHSFWQWRTGIPGVLSVIDQHSRKITIQKKEWTPPPLTPGPCRRQWESTGTKSQKWEIIFMSNNRGLPNKSWQIQSRNSMPFKWYWRQLIIWGKFTRVLSEDTTNNILSLFLCTDTHTSVRVPMCGTLKTSRGRLLASRKFTRSPSIWLLWAS